MDNWIFIGALTVLYGALLWWSARRLPAEKWQIAAAIPVHKTKTGDWRGVNLTYYGVFSANALAGACLMFLVLIGALGIPFSQGFMFLAPLLSVCFPASRIFARWVEKKPATATVGGAYFAGILIAPWLAWFIMVSFQGLLAPAFDVLPLLAALSISYVLGEGMGRLACISFGCCYGLPLERCPAWARFLFRRRHFVFTGPMKKASYESGLLGKPLAPIQTVTSIVYGAAGLGGALLFLQGRFTAALLLTSLVGGVWRAYSEVLRADFRGRRKFTAYQKMALAGAAYAALLACILDSKGLPAPVIGAGLDMLWDPAPLLALQCLWVFVLLAAGASKVTRSTIRFHLIKSKI